MGLLSILNFGIQLVQFLADRHVPGWAFQNIAEPMKGHGALPDSGHDDSGRFGWIGLIYVPVSADDGHVLVQERQGDFLRHDAVRAELAIALKPCLIEAGGVAVNNKTRNRQPPASVVLRTVGGPRVEAAWEL